MFRRNFEAGTTRRYPGGWPWRTLELGRPSSILGKFDLARVFVTKRLETAEQLSGLFEIPL